MNESECFEFNDFSMRILFLEICLIKLDFDQNTLNLLEK